MLSRMKKLNNCGVSLFVVVVCIAILSILGTLMVSVTMTNLQMKMIEGKSKKNFYSCEKAMEEIRTAVQEITATAIRKVYETKVLNNYASYLPDDRIPEDVRIRNQRVQNLVIIELVKALGDPTTYLYDETGNRISPVEGKDILLIKDYFDVYLSDKEITDGEESDKEKTVIVNQPKLLIESEPCVRIQDLTVKYNNGEYSSAITSDIVVQIPDFIFAGDEGEAGYKLEWPFQDYILVADHQIEFDDMDIDANETYLKGSIYAGSGGINFNGRGRARSLVNIQGENIVTRGDINVSNTAKLAICSDSNLPLIWSNNIVVGAPGSTSPTDLTIQGICLVKDDLVLNGRNSRVVFEKDKEGAPQGAYIGYTGTNSAAGSAIMLNGAGSNLDLSGLSQLILAGRAHMSVNNNDNDHILTGESIAFKSNQRAYLLPKELIANKFNPVREEEYSGEKPIITDGDIGGISYTDYARSEPKEIIIQTWPKPFRYYYLNFYDGKSADAFLEKYFSFAQNQDIMNRMDPFGITGEVRLPADGSIFTAGNAMSYRGGRVQLKAGLSTEYDTDTKLNKEIANMSLSYPIDDIDKVIKVGELSGLYSRISHLLDVNSTKTYQNDEDDSETAGSFLKGNDVTALISMKDTLPEGIEIIDGDKEIEAKGVFSGICIVKGNITIKSEAQIQKGILIATGNITVEDKVKIQGMLVAMGELADTGKIILKDKVTVNGCLVAADLSPDKRLGEILLGSDNNISMDPEVKNYLMEMFQANGTVLYQLFKGASVTECLEAQQASFVDLSNIITYENWKKTDEQERNDAAYEE